MQAKKVSVAVIDHHTLLRESLHFCMNRHSPIEIVWTAGDSAEALEKISEDPPQVAMIDVDLPGRGVFDIIHKIMVTPFLTRVIFFSDNTCDAFVDLALQLNVGGYLVKDEPFDAIVEGVLAVAEGEQCFSPQVAQRICYDPTRSGYRLKQNRTLQKLTQRQLQILRFLAKGDSVKSVAKSMHLSEKSVDSHKYRIMRKLNIHDRVELALYAIREGITAP